MAPLVPQLAAGFGDPALSAIEEWRAAWRGDETPLVDGTLDAGPYDRNETIAQICQASRGRNSCVNLHLLALLSRPKRILEFGTGLGISSAYLAMAQRAAGENGVIHTVDASPYRLRQAKHLHEAIGITNVSYECGRFAEVIPDLMLKHRDFDMIFVDAQLDAKTVRILFDSIAPALAPVALYLHGNADNPEGTTAAWNTIRNKPSVYSQTILSGLGVAILRAPDPA